MSEAETALEIGFVEPHLKLFGGIRRVVELANHLTDRGHRVTIYHPEGTPCEWLVCRADIRPTGEALQRSHDVLVYNDPNPRDHGVVRRADARLKVFYLLALYEKELLTGLHPSLWLRPRGHMAVTKRALRSADLLLANSTWMYRWLRDVAGLEARVLIGGINRDHFFPDQVDSTGAGGFRILHSGDPRPRKGSDTVEEALRRVRATHPDIRVETYHGKGFSQSEMAGVYGAADLFVDAQRYAGWNNPVVEAMACGVAVVCSDIGGVADFAFHEQTALLAPPDDPEALARAINRMIEDAGLRRRLRNNALDHVAQFSWQRSARRMESVLLDALDRATSPAAPLRQRVGERLKRSAALLRGRGRHFDKYDLRGAYHWEAYENDPAYRRHVEHIIGLLEPRGTLLDIGCGDGLITAKLADVGFDAAGIDIEPTAIRLARDLRPDISFTTGDVFELQRAADVVVASEVIEHVSEPDAFLRALRPLFTEYALITTPERDYYSEIDRYHETEYAYHEYVALMKRHFSYVDVRAAGGHLYALVRKTGHESGTP